MIKSEHKGAHLTDETIRDGDIQSVKSVPLSTRLDFIDGIRAFAALFVVICHAFVEPTNGYYSSWLMNHIGLSYGHIAVDVFIVLSGFCLTLPMAKRDGQIGSLREFLSRRARRILPPYYAALFLSCVFILVYAHNLTETVWNNCLPLTWSTFLKHLMLVHDLPLPGDGGTINYPLWSIAVEVQLYLVMPLIALSLRRFRSVPTMTAAIVLGIGLHIVSRGRLDTATPWYLGLFTIGAVAAREGHRHDLLVAKKARPVMLWLWIAVAVLMVTLGRLRFGQNEAYTDTLIGFASGLLLYICLSRHGEQQDSLTRILSWRPLVFVGGFSYSLYLVHAPLLHLFDRLLAPYISAGPIMFLALLLCMPLIIAFAYLFHLAFEKPFMSVRSLPKFDRAP